MTTQHDLERPLRAWLHATLDPIPEPTHRYPRIAAEVARSPQGRTWPSVGVTAGLRSVVGAGRIVVAGTVVAAFTGALLLAWPSGPRLQDGLGMAGSSPDATTTLAVSAAPTMAAEAPVDGTPPDDLLPGVALTVETEAPGVWRLTGDGMRDLTTIASTVDGALFSGHMILAAADATVWMDSTAGLLRLGDERNADGAYAVGRDGRLHESKPSPGDALPEFHPHPSGKVLFSPNGDIWVEGLDRRDAGPDAELRVALLTEDGWRVVPEPPGPGHRPQRRIARWDVSDDGTLTVARGTRISRFDGQAWEAIERPGGSLASLVAGPDGSLWVERQAAAGSGALHWRPDDRTWTQLETDASARIPHGPVVAVGPDGRYWFGSSDDPTPTDPCGSLGVHDGASTTRYLKGHCILAIDVDDAGRAWVLSVRFGDDEARTPGPLEIHVIDPEVAARPG